MRLTILLIGIGLLAGCEKEETPPRSVTEFVDNPILLEAAMVRCSRDRNESRYDPECINAREAVKRVQAAEEETRRIELEARSESKRKALRRMQEAQEEARRRTEQAERLRKEAEYLAQFGVLPPADDDAEDGEAETGNVPIAVVPEPAAEKPSTPSQDGAQGSVAGSNAPGIEIEPPPDDEG